MADQKKGQIEKKEIPMLFSIEVLLNILDRHPIKGFYWVNLTPTLKDLNNNSGKTTASSQP